MCLSGFIFGSSSSSPAGTNQEPPCAGIGTGHPQRPQKHCAYAGGASMIGASNVFISSFPPIRWKSFALYQQACSVGRASDLTAFVAVAELERTISAHDLKFHTATETATSDHVRPPLMPLVPSNVKCAVIAPGPNTDTPYSAGLLRAGGDQRGEQSTSGNSDELAPIHAGTPFVRQMKVPPCYAYTRGWTPAPCDRFWPKVAFGDWRRKAALPRYAQLFHRLHSANFRNRRSRPSPVVRSPEDSRRE